MAAWEMALYDEVRVFWSPAKTWWLVLLLVLGANLLWAEMSAVPPAWDMAYHQLKGYEVLDWWRQGGPIGELATISPNYPPLYYLVEALALDLAPKTTLLAFWSNLLGVFLLSFCTWRLARGYLAPSAAVWAGILPLLFPMSAWVFRESLLDGLLAAWVAAAGLCLARSDSFQRLQWAIAFGLVSALGVLTKWTFPVYLAIPVIMTVAISGKRLRTVANLTVSALVSIPLVLPYYWPNLTELASRYPTTHQSGLIPWKAYPRHGEPGLDNLLGWIYYPRTYASYFLFVVLTAFFLIGVGRLLRKRIAERGEPPPNPSGPGAGNRAILWGWLLGGAVALIFVTPKDPRFALPLACPLAILLLLLWRDRSSVQTVIVCVAILQFILVSFHTPMGRVKLAFFGRGDSDYQDLQREWVLFETNYFDVAGPPEREDWGLNRLLDAIPDAGKVAFLPDLARFHPAALQLAAVKAGRPIRVFKIGDTETWRESLRSADYVVGKTGWQGISFITQYNSPVVAEIESEDWLVAGRWDLPDGSQSILWKRGPQ